jgi:CDP-diacylglycerol--glycerol-3-phosphate 3-phosphatidyltransferase
MGLVHAWMVMIILGRELAVTGLRNVAAGRGVLIPASPLGKGKMVSQVTAIFLLLLSRPFPILGVPAQLVLWVVVGLTVLSGVDYFWRFGRGILRGSPPPPGPGPASLRPTAEVRLK